MFELPIEQFIFLFLAAVAVFAAFNVILQRNPIYSALGLIGVMCALAGTFIMLAAQSVAAMQVVVYAGAIMVLFVFVIMMLNVRREESRLDKGKYLKIVAPLLFLALLAEVFYVAKAVPNPPASAIAADGVHPYGTIESIGEAMFSTYLFPFEATSVLILMAMVGALFLAKKRTTQEAETLGQIILEMTPRISAADSSTAEEIEEPARKIAA